ncbi:PREDICTED: uncharacterized protein LOC109468059 [Branchiostoma belcheri]|uniref:Uncharacterized protein LOC109468059 n=1 Tax=Branchiostoma belcheri TaxID=7741 RepID=A0A6P4YJ63_BRABE|nr:PREDICTED: uncharacterized protein LOC109468059 [Branchiostoma belcheri]
MKVSVLLLVTLVLLAASTAAMDLEDVKTKNDVRAYIKAAGNKVEAAKALHAKMVSQGKDKIAKRFIKRARRAFKKRRQQRKDD